MPFSVADFQPLSWRWFPLIRTLVALSTWMPHQNRETLQRFTFMLLAPELVPTRMPKESLRASPGPVMLWFWQSRVTPDRTFSPTVSAPESRGQGPRSAVIR